MLLLLLLLLPLLWANQEAKETKDGGARVAAMAAKSRVPDPRFLLTAQKLVTVQEGLCITVSCNVSYPRIDWTLYTPAHGYWFQEGASSRTDAPVATNKPGRKVQEETQGRFHLLGDPRTHTCSLDIRDAQRRDTGTYFFRVERGSYVKYDYQQHQVVVNVTALTQTPVIGIQGTLESGRPRNLTCSVPWACERGTPPSFSWTSAALTSLGPRTRLSSVLSLTPRAQDHGTNVTCQVHFPAAGVTVERTVQLHVTYAPQDLTIRVQWREGTEMKYGGNGSSLPVQEGDSLRLLCVTHSNPPAELSWAQGQQTLRPSQPSHPGVLELPQIQMEHEGEFTCQAQHPLGSLHVSLHLSVLHPPQLLGPSCSWEDEGLHCSCSSRALPAPSLCWGLEDRLLEGNLSNAAFKVNSSSAGPWANSSVSLRRGLHSSLRLECEAQNELGKQRGTLVLLPGRPGPRTGVVQGAIGGAAVTALLALCLCLIFFVVKIYRKNSTEKAASQSGVSQSQRNESSSDSPSDHQPPAVAASTSENQEELHYATLSFHGLKPRELQDPETTEYSEIKIWK